MTYSSGIPKGSVRARVLMVAGILTFACVLASARPQNLPEALRQTFEAGVAAEKAGRLDEAARDFQEVLRQNGNLAFVHNDLGTVYQQRGDHARAITQFHEAIRLDPNYAAPRVLLGASLLATGKAPAAVQELERAVKLDPKQPSPHLELAKAYERVNNLAGTVDQYRELRELAPHDPEYIYQAGQAYLRLSQWCLEQMRRIDPHSARIDESLAEAYRAQGRMDEAVRAFARAAQTDPKLPGVHLALAQIDLQQGKIENARKEIDLELAIVPESRAAKAIQEQLVSPEPKP